MRISDWSSDVCSSDLVAVVLVPIPGAAGARTLHRQLRMVMVDLAAQQPLDAVDQPLAARDAAEEVVARVVPERTLGRAALAVAEDDAIGAGTPVELARLPTEASILPLDTITPH